MLNWRKTLTKLIGKEERSGAGHTQDRWYGYEWLGGGYELIMGSDPILTPQAQAQSKTGSTEVPQAH